MFPDIIASMCLPDYIDKSIPRREVIIGKYKCRIVYREGDVYRTLEKRRLGLFGRWRPLFSDKYEACVEELKSRVKEFQKPKPSSIIYALIRPKDLED